MVYFLKIRNFARNVERSHGNFILSHVKSHNINAEISCQNRPRSIYQYSTMDTRLPGKTAIFSKVFLVSQSPRDLAWMQVKHHQLWKPENFGTMLEKRYDIERGLLRSFLSIARGRRGGFMVSALDSGSRGRRSGFEARPGTMCCVLG